jgi:type II secretory pathway pseudopilin PulG
VRRCSKKAARAVRCSRPDSGFSLVEAVVATAVLGMLAASMGLVFVGGVRSSVELQHRQLATTIAAQAMELVRAVLAQSDSAGCSPLLAGRTQSAVTAQWAAAPSGVDLSTTDVEWADSSGGSSAVAVPLAGLTTSVADDGTAAITREASATRCAPTSAPVGCR